MKTSEASLNFLSLEIAVSVCAHKIFFFILAIGPVYKIYPIWVSTVIFLNSLSKGQAFVFIFFPNNVKVC